MSDAQAMEFKTQLAAVEYLQGRGFKVKKSRFNRDVKAGLVGRTAEGAFPVKALTGYARTHLPRDLAVKENSRAATAARRRVEADARLKETLALRAEHKMAIETGKYVLREDLEAALAMRAAFFKNEVENFCVYYAPRIVALLGAAEEKIPELARWLEDQTATWLDAFSADREFCVPGTCDEEAFGDTPSQAQDQRRLGQDGTAGPSCS